MKKIFYFLLFVSLCVVSAKAQVTIGSLDAPERGAVLELKSDTLGFLPPRVELIDLTSPDPLPVHVEGMIVFNTNTNSGLEEGIYYNTGTKWIHLVSEAFAKGNWFYMPSTVIATSPVGSIGTKDLYQAYLDQFGTTVNTVRMKSEASAPELLTALPQATDFYYYVIGYDTDVFSNVQVSPEGMLSYDIIGEATDTTYMNIVFLEK